MKRFMRAALVVFAVLLSVKAADALSIDQQNLVEADRWGLLQEEMIWGQSITSQVDGYLDGFEFFLSDGYFQVHHFPEYFLNASQSVSARVLVDNALVATVSREYDGSRNYSLFFDFSGFDILLRRGQSWLIELSGDYAPLDESAWTPIRPYLLELTLDDEYVGGALSLNGVPQGSNGGMDLDLRFVEYVRKDASMSNAAVPVPEPSTLFLFGGVLAALGLVQAKGRRRL